MKASARKSKQSAAERALEAISDLIAEAARGTSRTRYVEVQRLAEIGQGLVHATASRVDDFQAAGKKPVFQHAGPWPAYGGVGVAIGGGGGGNVMAPMPMPVGGPLDQQAILRQMLLLVGPMIQVQTERGRAAIAFTEAEELNAVSQGVEAAQKRVAADKDTKPDDVLARWNRTELARLRERREQLVENIAARAARKDKVDATGSAHAGLPMVPPDVPRGHPPLGAEGGGRGGDGPPGVRPDPNRGAGDGRAPRARPRARKR